MKLIDKQIVEATKPTIYLGKRPTRTNVLARFMLPTRTGQSILPMANSTRSPWEQATRRQPYGRLTPLQSVWNEGNSESVTAEEQPRNWLMRTMRTAKAEDGPERHWSSIMDY